MLQPTSVRHQEFARSHGDNAAPYQRGLLFGDGARIRQDGLMMPPPTDERQLAILRHAYAKARLEVKEEQYRRENAAIASAREFAAAGVGCGPAAGWKAHLEKLEAEIAQLRQELAAAPDPRVVEFVQYQNTGFCNW